MVSFLKIAALVLLLLTILCLGVAQMINPDWFIKRSGVRKGGELLSDWNQFGFQICGGFLTAFAAYMLYVLWHHLTS
jgi:hypothetical protein